MTKFAKLIKRPAEDEYLFKLEPPMKAPHGHKRDGDVEYILVKLNKKIPRNIGSYTYYAYKSLIWPVDIEGNDKKYLYSSMSGGDEFTIEQIIEMMPESEKERGSYKPILYKMKEGTEKKWGGLVRNL